MEPVGDKNQFTTPLPQFTLRVTPGNATEIDAWRKLIAPMYDFEIVGENAQKEFALESFGTSFAGIGLSRATSKASIFRRTSATISQSGLDTVTLLCYTKGCLTLSTTGEIQLIPTGEFVVLDMSQPFTITASDYENIALSIPRQLLEPHLPAVDSVHGMVIDRTSPFLTHLVTNLILICDELGRFTLRDAPLLAQFITHLVAVAINSALERKTPKATSSDFSTLQKLRRAIEQELGNPELSVKSLTLRHGISRTTIYRLFEPLEGVQNYIQQRRLARIYQTITDPAHDSEKIGIIASRYGFSNATNFSRSFRSLYGISPREARKRAQEGTHKAPAPVNSFEELNRWVLGLETPSPVKS